MHKQIEQIQTSKIEISHDTEKKKFYTIIDGNECLLQYYYTNPTTMDFAHTYVPFVLRGRGIAADILKTAAEYAKQNNKKVIPSCSYAYHFFSRHQEYADLL